MSETLFKEVHYPLETLINDICLHSIQRPFAWVNTKVHALFDSSMHRGCLNLPGATA